MKAKVAGDNLRSSKEIVRSSRGISGFLLLKPKGLQDADTVARRIASCSNVSRVFLTSGEYGFVIASNSDTNGIRKIKKNVRKASNGARLHTVIAHCSYAVRNRQH